MKTAICVFLLLTFACVSLFAQSDEAYYSAKWRTADSLKAYGLTKNESKTIVSEIFEKARKENNTVNLIRAVLYKVQMAYYFDEDLFLQNLGEMVALESESVFPTKQILSSLIGDMYWYYYTNNRYKILNRTRLSTDATNDTNNIKTWDISKIVEKMFYYYGNSLSEQDKLMQINIEKYEELLNEYVYDKKTPDGRRFRPTLYDFLAFKAVYFFADKESAVTRPADQFFLNDSIYLSDAAKFATVNVSTTDTFSFQYHTIKVLQDIIKFHLNDANPDALIDADLIRLIYVFNSSVNPEKESLYLKSLKYLDERFSGFQYSTMVKFSIAKLFYQKGGRKESGTENTDKDDFKNAHIICENAISSYPGSEGSEYCRNLISEIEKKSIDLKLEEYYIPNRSLKALVTYRNLNKIYLRVIRTSYKELDAFNAGAVDFRKDYFTKVHISELIKRDPAYANIIELPSGNDYRTHKTEIRIPPLPAGEYIMLAGTDKNFSDFENAVAYSLVNVNSICYIEKKNSNDEYEYYVLDRETGQPLDKVNVSVCYLDYVYDSSLKEFIKTDNFVTDKNGYFKFSFHGSRTFYLEMEYHGQTLSTKGYSFGQGKEVWKDEIYYWRHNNRESKPDMISQTYFFTDRSLYRPGQIVYFKGLVIEGRDGDWRVKTGKTVKVLFYGTNSQKIESQTFVTNEFGTFDGCFTIPNEGLNGKMHMKTIEGDGYTDFSVEDYKRPKFEVVFSPVKGAYKLGQEVTVKGTAMTYSGAKVDGASVKYKITRSVHYPNWYYYWYNRNSFSLKANTTVITNGTLVTDGNGEFEIKFNAIPDETVVNHSKPNFVYNIVADVTDINGETHSRLTSITVGHNTLMINFDIMNEVDKNGNNVYKMNTTNMNGEKEPASGSITISKLKSPDRTFRNRLWERPDTFTMSKEEYYASFPFDEYYNENDYTVWEKETVSYQRDIETGIDSVLDLREMRNWSSGKYIAEISLRDKFGGTINEKYYFDLYGMAETDLPYASFDRLIYDSKQYETGQTVKILFGTSLRNTKVLLEVDSFEGKILSQWFNIDSAQRCFEIPVKESYKGALSFNFVFVKEGRMVSRSDLITVPSKDNSLDISFNTFRYKTHPGGKEEWEIKIKGKEGSKVEAEMVASAYDASLDDIKKHNWFFQPHSHNISDNISEKFKKWYWPVSKNPITASVMANEWNKYFKYYEIIYDRLNTFRSYNYLNLFQKDYKIQELVIEAERKGIDFDQSGRLVTIDNLDKIDIRGGRTNENILIVDGMDTSSDFALLNYPKNDKKFDNKLENITVRKDFRETIFFKPDLKTNKKGIVTIKFEVPEALTKWKFMGFAHTKDLKAGMITKEFITQKELMVTPNVPRYLREDDKVVITAKINNLSDKDMNGTAALFISDAETKKNIDAKFNNVNGTKKFDVKKDGSTIVSWEIQVPYGFETVNYKVVAKADNLSDGEEAELPVLSNRMLVTENMPFNIRGNEPKILSMERLIKNASSSLTNYCLTLEFTSNPAWYAILSLPYLMEFPHECAEQMFSRVYANSIAAYILKSQPKIKAVFDKWKETGSNALTSDLEKNEELKSLILQETPWVIEAKNDNERKLRIGYLFEMNRMSNELDRVMRKLKSMQKGSGAWPWFEGCPESRFITQHICAGLGKLYKLGIRKYDDDMNMVNNAVNYLDNQIRKDFEQLEDKAKSGKINLESKQIDYSQIHYLYMRSFFRNIAIENQNKQAFEYFLNQERKFWNDREIQIEGMIALTLNRFDDTIVSKQIVNYLKENSTTSEELGMYWKSNKSGYYWYEAPIETQALMIEVFDEVANDGKSVDDMKVWLLKNKQVNDWKTTKATVEAVYALLLKGDDLLSSGSFADILVGNNKIDMNDAEAGSGYIKTNWKWGEIKPEMGNVTVTRKSSTGISWGSLYWQYFEDLDKISKQETELKIEKKLFVVENTGTGEVLKPVEGRLKVGDKVRVRITIRTDRDMEFVQMKDLRAAGFEPVNTLSEYKYQDGLGYYESTRDAATYFFFDYLRKGTYVLEYDLRVNLKGDYSNGITTIQSMYAPEFAGHSEGIRVKVE